MKTKQNPISFESVIALRDELAPFANDDSVKGELHWIYSEIVKGGKDEMNSVEGIYALLAACSDNGFGENPNLFTAGQLADKKLFG